MTGHEIRPGIGAVVPGAFREIGGGGFRAARPGGAVFHKVWKACGIRYSRVVAKPDLC